MAPTKKPRDFLDRELFVNRNIVTFRSLSRALGIHVDDAKKELQRYYDAVRDTCAPAVPTYLVSGEVPSEACVPPERPSDAMDLDLEFEEDRSEDVVHETAVLLVDARALEETKSRFSRVYSVHVYSLSPARFGDAGLVCVPTWDVRKADAREGPASFAITGKVTGPHVKRKAGRQHVASSSKMTLDASSKEVPKVIAAKATAFEKKEPAAPVPKTEPKEKPKLSGKLDWSKAKTKDKEPAPPKVKEEKKPKLEPEPSVIRKSASANKKATLDSVFKPGSGGAGSAGVAKRGVKRKPHMETEEEEESDAFLNKADSRIVVGSSVKQEVTDSDSEDGKVRMLGLRRPKRKSAMSSTSEMSLRAMMDIDDELVDRVTRGSKSRPEPQESEESSEDEREKEATAPPATSEDEESDHVPIVPKKRKPRKVVPVGRNGLKKRRVVKSRMTTDAKGYMQTEDYSSYESVEEEEEVKPNAKTKAKGTKKEKASDKAEEPKTMKEEVSGKPKPKAAAKPRGGAPKRGGLLNFFGPEKVKK